MTLLSAYHTPPVLQIRAALWFDNPAFTPSYATFGPVTLTSPAAWYGTRAGAAAGEDLLRGLYLLAVAVMTEALITEWRIDDQGRLRIGLAASTDPAVLLIDFDHAATTTPPEYWGLAPSTTGIQMVAYATDTDASRRPYALPYLWTPGQDAAVDHEEERITQETERTSRGYLSPIVSRRYSELTVEYDTVEVARVLTSHVATPPGAWSAYERLMRAAVGPPVLGLLYLPQASAQATLTSTGEALDVETWGPYQVRDSHLGRPLGRSQRAEDAPERWDVVAELEDEP
jgi:hypothetical protein